MGGIVAGPVGDLAEVLAKCFALKKLMVLRWVMEQQGSKERQVATKVLKVGKMMTRVVMYNVFEYKRLSIEDRQE